MNLLILIPIVLLVITALLIFGRRHRTGGTGLGDRRDSTERPELRGSEQAKDRF